MKYYMSRIIESQSCVLATHMVGTQQRIVQSSLKLSYLLCTYAESDRDDNARTASLGM